MIFSTSPAFFFENYIARGLLAKKINQTLLEIFLKLKTRIFEYFLCQRSVKIAGQTLATFREYAKLTNPHLSNGSKKKILKF